MLNKIKLAYYKFMYKFYENRYSKADDKLEELWAKGISGERYLQWRSRYVFYMARRDEYLRKIKNIRKGL